MKKFIIFILLIGGLSLVGCSQGPIAEKDKPYMNLPKTDAQLADPTLAIPMCADACDKEGLELDGMRICMSRCTYVGTTTFAGRQLEKSIDELPPLK